MAAKKLSDSFSKMLIDEVQKWGCMKQTGVSLRYMMEFGSKPTERNLLFSAAFLHKELPIRIARRAIELESLPYGLSEKPAVLKVRDWYLDSFRDLRSFPEIKNSQDEKEFTQMIKAIKDSTWSCIIQTLHLTALGTFTRKCPLWRLLGMLARMLVPFAFVSTALRQKLSYTETRASHFLQERFMDLDKVAPPVRIIVAEGIEDVTIKVSDEGGGIRRSDLPKIFTYLYSTARNPLDDEEELNSSHPDTVTTMAGYGYGLPISRLYARYFGGDMQIISMEGYGTDAYLHLSRLGDSQEPLP